MKKPTGPARIEILSGNSEAAIAALLFNFDFDDDAVKPEHQAWLREHAVPSLKATNQRIFLRGIASQIGDRQYNLQLSKRRVQAVSKFLIGQGVTAQQVVTTFTGEDLSTSLLADDERDRAVEATFEVSAGPMRFERVIPTESKDGFDEFSDPPTMVVPQQASRLIRLLGGAGAVVQSLNPRVVRPVDPFHPGANPVVATSNDFLLRLEPGLPGPAQLVAHFPQASAGQPVLGFVGVPKPQVPPRRIGAQKVFARLFIRTLPLRTVSIAFHYVKTDGKGAVAPVGVRTERVNSAAEQADWLRHMNRIYLPQANIGFQMIKPAQDIDSNGVQGPDVDVSPLIIGSNDGEAIIQGRRGVDRTARFRVFFVGRLGHATEIGGVVLQIGQPDCLCQDGMRMLSRIILEPLTTDPLIVAQVLAHEAGHSFNERDANDPDLLMHKATTTGERIPLDAAQRMNDFLK
jgi:hypothetical protein